MAKVLAVFLFAEECSGGLIFLKKLIPRRKKDLKKRKKQLTKKNTNLFQTGAKAVNLLKKFRAYVKRNPSIPAVQPRRSLAAVPRDKNYDPCADGQVCVNGVCVNKGGKLMNSLKTKISLVFTAIAPGRILSGSAVSVADAYTIIDIASLAKAKKEFPNAVHNPEEHKLEVKYRCDCLEGYFGDLCELTPNDIECQADFCLNNGVGEWRQNEGEDGHCHCTCDPGYAGEQCEYMLPCPAYDCNYGTCKDEKIEDTNGDIAFEPKCECGGTFPYTMITIHGENCSRLEVPGPVLADPEKMGVIPCVENDASPKDWKSWISNVEKYSKALELSSDDVKLVKSFSQQCRRPKPDSSTGGDYEIKPENWDECNEELGNHDSFCLNGGVCQPLGIDLKSATKLMVPSCDCEDEYEGTYCQYRRRDACDPTMDEFINGLTRSHRCTHPNNGVCNSEIRKNEAVCLCHVGYSGTLCEKFDPCAEAPCPLHSHCVALDPDKNRRESMSLKLYRCVCNDGYQNASPDQRLDCQPGNNTGRCVDKSLCLHGNCHDCGNKAPEGNIDLCDEHENLQRYKCFCHVGFSGYRCDHPLSACATNECKNGAICREVDAQDYRCVCRPGTRGSFCEHVDDYCIAFGFDVCVNGNCFESIYLARGFECECWHGWGGRNCEVELDLFERLEKAWNKHEAVLTGIVFTTLTTVIIIFFHCLTPPPVKSKDKKKMSKLPNIFCIGKLMEQDQDPELDISDVIIRLINLKGWCPPFPLGEWEVLELCRQASAIFASQPMLLNLDAPMKICGDIHGQFYDLLRIFELGGYPPKSNYLFLGDYVDRGKQSLEVICLLFAFKIKYPENFFLLRGNHEDAAQNYVWGFYDECITRLFDRAIYREFNKAFAQMPVAAIVGQRIFCAHGGISRSLESMKQIMDLPRLESVPSSGLLCDILWSDPDSHFESWGPNTRGISMTYGIEAADEFLDRFGLDLICRAHQVVEDGYEFAHEKRVLTLFSAPNYSSRYDNAAAILNVGPDLLCSIQILKPTKDAREPVIKKPYSQAQRNF
ncbi:unnamed protein product, partial [Mesorhabditis spiculigera]